MTDTKELPAEIMDEARKAFHGASQAMDGGSQLKIIALALLSRDAAARKECVEIARKEDDGGMLGFTAEVIATAIEATITGGGDAE